MPGSVSSTIQDLTLIVFRESASTCDPQLRRLIIEFGIVKQRFATHDWIENKDVDTITQLFIQIASIMNFEALFTSRMIQSRSTSLCPL